MDRTAGRKWRDLAPGLGLIAGAVVAMLFVAVLSGGDAGPLAIGIAVGAAIGLVAGAIVRSRNSSNT